MPREMLAPEDVSARLAELEGWALEAGKAAITKTFAFRDFSEAFAFMTRVAMAAEKLDHHPDWSNVYRKVEVRLTTHDAGGLTQLDFELASRIDRFARGWGQK